MDTSPTLSLGGSKARAALLATGTGTGGSDRRVVFLASQATTTSSINSGTHETRTWPHHWSPHTTGNSCKSPADSPHSEHKLRMPRGQTNWTEDAAGNSNTTSRRNPARSQVAGTTPSTSTLRTTATTTAQQHQHQQQQQQQQQQHQPHDDSNAMSCNGFRLGVYGWRKRCLYSLVLGLMVIVILNLALTVWLLKVMGFTSEGLGSLKIVPGGVELRGQAAILDTLVASSLKSRAGKNLVLESWSNFTASARSHDGKLLARFTLGEDRVDCVSKGFRITNPEGGVLFSADKEQVVVGAKVLKVTGIGGAVFQGSVQTPLVRAESGHGLRLESATRSLEIRAPQKVILESWAGEITASCLTDLKLQSIEGAIKFDAKSVFLKGLKTASLSSSGSSFQGRSSREQQSSTSSSASSASRSSSSYQKETNVYQLCACENGKLFLARSEGVCQADKNVC